MSSALTEDLRSHYEQDETAWLERTASLIREGRAVEVDYPSLTEYLDGMAKRDRREVESRLAGLLAHALKWTYLPDQRGGSWRATVEAQRHELELLLTGGTLRNHAEAELASAFAAALRQASLETGIDSKAMPRECPYTVAQLLTIGLPTEEA